MITGPVFNYLAILMNKFSIPKISIFFLQFMMISVEFKYYKYYDLIISYQVF